MTTMISEVYAAFLSVGVTHEVAQKAAESLSSESLSTKSDLTGLEKRIDTSITNLDKKIDSSISSLDKKIDSSVAILGRRIDALTVDLDKKIDALTVDLEKKIESVRFDLSKDIQGVKTDVAVLKWMTGLLIAGVTSLVIKTFLT